MKKSKLTLRCLCEAAIMIALAQILGYLKLYELPQGGSITLSMLPIFLFCSRWGFGPGMLASFAFSLLQLFLDGAYAWSWQSMLGDYIFAFTVLGFAGLFSKKRFGFFYGTLLGSALRFLVHYVVGATVWGEYMPETFFGMTMTSPWFYSALYNGSYMVLDCALVLLVGWILWKPMGKYIRGDDIKALRGDGKDDINNKWFIGQPLSVYYDWNMIGIWQEGDEFTFIDKEGKEVAHQTGATPGAAKLEDVDGNGVIDSKDRKVIGSKQPSFTMSMGNRFSYKDFYFSFLFNGVFGKWMTDNVANISSYTFGSGNYIHGVKYWTPETPDAEVVSPGYQASFSHGYYKKLNYVQLRNITLGYRVNQKFVRRIGLSAIDVNFSVNNVCAFSNMRQMLNYDNTWFASFPTARSYVLGLTLTF